MRFIVANNERPNASSQTYKYSLRVKEINVMGVLRIVTAGSFPFRDKQFSAIEHGHAHAVAQAIRYLSEEVLPEAIDRDHRLHDEGAKPSKGFAHAEVAPVV